MNQKCIYYLTVIFLTLTGVFLFYTPTHADIIFKGDFEGGNFSGWSGRDYCCSYSQQIVTAPVRAGKYAARHELRYTDPVPATVGGGVRTEVDYHNRRFGKLGGPDEWYGFSIYLPSDYGVDSEYELVAQWKSWPDKGEVHRSPVLGLYIKAGNWEIVTRYSSKPIQTSNDGTLVGLWKAPYQKGVWTDWVVHVKWSYQSDGFVQMWKNGQKIVDYKGPNAYNDTQEKQNINFRQGIYKWPWNNCQPGESLSQCCPSCSPGITKRVVYHDELRIGDSNSSYAEVAPRSSTPDTMPPSQPTLTLANQK